MGMAREHTYGGWRTMSAIRVYASCCVLLVLWGCGAPNSSGLGGRADVLQLGSRVQAVRTQDFLQLAGTPPPRELAAGAEVVFISGYEVVRRADADVSVHVTIDRPGAKVLLVLSSYDKVLWKVDASRDTNLAGILVSSANGSTVSTHLATRAWAVKLPYATETENANFRGALAALRQTFGTERVDVFRGSYGIPGEIVIRGVDAKRQELTLVGPRPVQPQRNLSFELLGADKRPLRWSLTGPLDAGTRMPASEGRLVVSQSLQLQFRLVSEGLEISNLLGDPTPTRLPLPPNFPSFSWAMDVAYDTRREVATVVSLGGEGFLYRFDARKRRWLDFRSMRNIDVFSLAYDDMLDRYVGWTDAGALLFIDAERGTATSRRMADRLPGFRRLYDGGNERTPRLVIVPRGDDIVLVHLTGGLVRAIWHYDVQADAVEFTYSSDS